MVLTVGQKSAVKRKCNVKKNEGPALKQTLRAMKTQNKP